ncbi:carbamoyl-phosphate synthase large subunit [bacterium]|nr:carbamoyl-phosphate synthase large subunit [bacterium]
MPKRSDIHRILLIGSGPIVIGQACEFDYSGTQACKSLSEEGYEVILINSNPATIMTDPEFAVRTYIEPITPKMVEKIIRAEKPDALLPTIGGQTGLNTAIELADSGVLAQYGVEMIGVKPASIRKAEQRDLFKQAMAAIGLDVPKSGYATTLDEARAVAAEIGRYPLIIRPSFTLGGAGGGIAYNKDEFEDICRNGIQLSLNHQILVEESVIGWKEYELEVMRDLKDNVVIICSIENVDPMGVHTGDSITVAPAQTLSDKCYQYMRDATIAVMREIGVETGGSNVQWAVDPATGRMVIIEMNPRVSRSSALASKATGFPIAKIAAKLAVGYTLDEIPNDITRKTPASFEPSIDYCVVKHPRFTFERFPGTPDVLTTQMRSVGETMAIGRTFKEALQKAMRSLETGRGGFGGDGKDWLRREGGGWVWREPGAPEIAGTQEIQHLIRSKLRQPNSRRLLYVRHALEIGFAPDEVCDLTKMDPWFIDNIRQILSMEDALRTAAPGWSAAQMREAKQYGFSDRQLAHLAGTTETALRAAREKLGVKPVYKLVDTCAAEFEACTPYYYSTYDAGEDESMPSSRRKIMILGGGPNRIGQGIEFDYCCVHASFALKEDGYETIMVNSNPETVSTDYDTSDKLYFEPVTFEDVLNIYEREKCDGVIVQFGGQTPLNLALSLQKAGVNIIGTSPESIDRAEDRKLFQQMLHKLKLTQPANGTAVSVAEALAAATAIGYPVLVRPSYVLGGRAMQIVYSDEELKKYMEEAVEVSPERPVLVDKFVEDAVEVDVDCVSDGDLVVIGGIMEHIEEAGIHSGDSACVLPPHTLGGAILDEIRRATIAMAKELGVCGLMNVQFAVRGGTVYVLEVNPRASRTVPFVSKAIGVPLAKIAARVMAGKTLRELGFTNERTINYFAVKEAVLPFVRFPGTDIALGPEMRSTGEVMGIDADLGIAFAKTQFGAGVNLPFSGNVFLSVRDADKRHAISLGKRLVAAGLQLVSTEGTARALRNSGVTVTTIHKIAEGRPNVIDLIRNGEIALIINTVAGHKARGDEAMIRATATVHNVPCITTLSGAEAAVNGIESIRLRGGVDVRALQEYHKGNAG